MGACISSMVRRIKQAMEACVSSMVPQIKKKQAMEACVSSMVPQINKKQAMEACVSSMVPQIKKKQAMEACISSMVPQIKKKQAMETRCVSSEVWQRKQREQRGWDLICGSSGVDIYIDNKVKEQIMSALSVRDQGENIIGLCGPKKRVEHSAQTAIRRAEKDHSFQKIVTTTVTKKPDITKIQTEIGNAIGLNFNDKTYVAVSTGCTRFGNSKRMITAERADLLCAKMKELQTVLIVMYDLHGRLNLGEIGIPFGEDHNGCKILLTSTSLEVLSKQMKVHKLIRDMA
ncbi:uncharacterized protein [Medicago truncatula]|nr:uncharacterized protein LOC11415874 isoform X2 [Medicago truncatula]